MTGDPLHDEGRGDHSGHEHALVMRFVVCESAGGDYPDEAFVAGFSAAVLDETLRALAQQVTNGLTAATVTRMVPPALVPQLDLIAMRHGFTLKATQWDEHPDDWSLATFTLGEGDADDA